MPSLRLISLLVIQAIPAIAGQGLRGSPQVIVNDVESLLLKELANNVRGGSASEHITKLETALGQLYRVVPKEVDGTLNHAVARYTLHRYFVQRSGWFIRGLEPGSGNQTANGPDETVQDLQEWVPSYLQSFLDQFLQGGGGISLRELAIIAATLEDLIEKESMQRLGLAFQGLEIAQDAKLDEFRLRQTLDVYMMMTLLAVNFTNEDPTSALGSWNGNWSATQKWMQDIQREVAPVSSDVAANFTSAARVLDEVWKRYAKYNDVECNSLKSELLEIESAKAGRVRLTEFYKKGLSAGVFYFNEKAEYLRTLGALDDSDPAQPYVIVTNYVASRPNCQKISDFYVVCCRNECEDLMGALEQNIGQSTATPEEILQIVSSLSSSTVPAPRKLSDTLLQRLQQIAVANEGVVPLHGRLFAQWMHHAFPRECPYPQQAGTSNPQTPDEWMQATGEQETTRSTEEMQAHVDSDTCGTLPTGAEAKERHDWKENALPWDEKEELLGPVKLMPAQPKATHEGSSFRRFASVPFVAGVMVFVWKLGCRGKTSQLLP